VGRATGSPNTRVVFAKGLILAPIPAPGLAAELSAPLTQAKACATPDTG